MRTWNNIEELVGYVIDEDEHGNFEGRLVDKDNKTIKSVGMDMDKIGYSSDKEKTESIVQKIYKETLGILEMKTKIQEEA